jgi:hypothetical protein
LFLLANFQQKRKTKSKIENEVNFWGFQLPEVRKIRIAKL